MKWFTVYTINKKDGVAVDYNIVTAASAVEAEIKATAKWSDKDFQLYNAVAGPAPSYWNNY